jgi:hypothetical protein
MKKLFLALLIALLLPWPVFARGIAMRFVDITLEHVEPGVSFSIRQLKNLPLIVANLEDEPVDIGISIEFPEQREMKESYEPMPDPNWVRVIPNSFHLGPKASAASDVFISIPNDPKLIGHHYEAIIWAHTTHGNKVLPQGGVFIETGLRSRIRISVGSAGPAALQLEKAMKRIAEINTNFSVSPDDVYAMGVDVGRTIDLKAEKKASLKVINEADEPVELKFNVVPHDPNISPASGYEDAPDLKWLTLSPAKMKMEGNSIREIKLKLNIPDKPEFRNKRYAFFVQTTLANEELPLAVNNVVYVNTAP